MKYFKFMEVQIMVTLRIDRDHMVSSSEIVRNFSKMLDKTNSPRFLSPGIMILKVL